MAIKIYGTSKPPSLLAPITIGVERGVEGEVTITSAHS